MNRFYILCLIAIGFIACEKDAEPIEFISADVIEDALRAENIIPGMEVNPRIEASRDNPVTIGLVDGDFFDAIDIDASFAIFTVEETLIISFEDTDQNQLTLVVENPQSRTYDVNAPGTPTFKVEYVNSDTGEFFVTDTNDEATGTLILDIDRVSEDRPIISAQFNFKAFLSTFNGNSDRSVTFTDGSFSDVAVR